MACLNQEHAIQEGFLDWPANDSPLCIDLSSNPSPMIYIDLTSPSPDEDEEELLLIPSSSQPQDECISFSPVFGSQTQITRLRNVFESSPLRDLHTCVCVDPRPLDEQLAQWPCTCFL